MMKPDWISVSDETPPTNKWLLIWTEFSGPRQGMLLHFDGMWVWNMPYDNFSMRDRPWDEVRYWAHWDFERPGNNE